MKIVFFGWKECFWGYIRKGGPDYLHLLNVGPWGIFFGHLPSRDER